ncbi:DNA sulfur modification protein DndD [Geobacter argillaceus]|uniref:DNA sulfur modification protein DndD n=1 Tax=Geobacter argillaceus TaxID=345631 RepID=A0A562W8C6_9BACT|nr:DNA sulfur modification protein DndD [Geobacter argillaceus]TWJ26539.1 DNA sulfur modification protein DndD [Geobacter argillaceus]
MILDTIILENYGAYGGRQEAHLTPDEGKPIILFGGMNGGGKTTLLDAVQLAFYGPKARISNRGRLAYKEYLRESIHRSGDPGEGAGITVRFRRVIEGECKNFELQRCWREGIKGIEETVRVLRDGLPDDISTEHWDEAIEAYLPSSIAHLFFFDGEQIKELAEGGHAAEILGTAIHSLLGLDLVDRLENDLKVFERRKKAEGLDPEAARKLASARSEFVEIFREEEQAASLSGALTNESNQLAKELHAKEELFSKEGGDLFLRRKELEDELVALKARKAATEAQFRELVAGPLPLLLVENLLAEVEQVVRHETEIKRARVLLEVLETRDTEVLDSLKAEKISAQPLRSIVRILEVDRKSRAGLAQETLILDADDTLAPQIVHLRGTVLPTAEQQARDLTSQIATLDEKIARLEGDLERVPTAERIAEVQHELEAARKAHQAKLAEIEATKVRRQALQRQRLIAEARLEKMGENDVNSQFSEDARLRMLKHSLRVRETLGRFRTKIVKRHTENMEALMLESFRKLLRKKELVSGLKINPETFEATLTTKDGKVLSFDRLSAGEKQLLATSLLWGLARASGRPVPTIIDTPLGRLDSSHRKHLIERYFPNASHQVLLLSTDEEIVGAYYKELEPFITRSYLLEHNEEMGQTNLTQGYFNI